MQDVQGIVTDTKHQHVEAELHELFGLPDALVPQTAAGHRVCPEHCGGNHTRPREVRR
jgi:hypothetical protein